MPRREDIEWSFRKAVEVEPNGRRIVTTGGFIRELAKNNWHWTPGQANKWIEIHVNTFKDISDIEGEQRTFMLFNSNGGL